MKPIHKVASKDDLRPSMQFIQVKDGFCGVTNGSVLLKIPTLEVFGEEVEMDDEIYFNAKEWAGAKFDKATSIERNGLAFQAKNRTGSVIGTVVAKSKEQFAESIGRFPDYNAVIVDPEKPLSEINSIAFCTTQMIDLCSAFGCNPENFQFFFLWARQSNCDTKYRK